MLAKNPMRTLFQSTLPRGSACRRMRNYNMCENFNPRSLAGATKMAGVCYVLAVISIHAPLRERQLL